jgi:hypothetical protein
MDANKSHGVAAEPDRVSTRVVVGFGILLAVLSFVAMVLMAVLFRGLDRRAEKKDDASIAAAGLELKPEGVPPLPRLQVYPVKHWKDFQAAEIQRLSTYGWMDRASGAVHVPIERAMDLIAVRGVGPLPAAPMAMPAAQTTPAAPTEAKP